MAWVSLDNLTRFYTKLKEKMYLKTEVDTKLSDKANSSHTHDDRYYTESEINTKLNGKANSSHTHSYNDLSNKPSIPSALSPYPVGSVYFSVKNTNPSSYFGGSWTQIGTKLVMKENVYGNGKALAMTDGSKLAGFTRFGGSPTTTQILDGIYSRNIGANRYNYSGNSVGGDIVLGVPTKAKIGSNLSNSGLVVETTTVYSWKRTA